LAKEVGALIKRLIGISLLIVLLGIVVYSHFYPVYEIPEETKETGTELPQSEYEFYEGEEFGRHGDIIIREDQRLISTYDIEDIDLVYDYLDPADTSDYEDLLSIYISYIPKCSTQNPESFFETNREDIGNILGIYSYSEFLSLNKTLNDEGIDKDSTITGVKLVSLKEDKGLLNAHIRLFYGEATLDMSHRLDYVYFGTQPYLFIYSEGGGVQ